MKSKLKTTLLTSLLVLLVACTQAADEISVKPSAAAPSSSFSKSAARDEIYIDDEGTDGSGGRGGIHDDIDKDPDYSGSGFGPDDEDAITDHHQSSHNTRVQNVGHTNTAHTPTTQTTTTISTSTTSTTISTTTEQTSTSSSTTPVSISISNTSTTPSSSYNQSQPMSTTTQRTPALPEPDEDDDASFEVEDTLHGSGDGDGDGDDDGDDNGEDDDAVDNADDDEEDEEDQLIDTNFNTEIKQTPITDLGSSKPVDDKHDVSEGDEDADDELYTDISIKKDDTQPAGGSGGSVVSTNVHELNPSTNINSQPTDNDRPKNADHRPGGNSEVVIMSEEDRTTSFFAQPGILAAVIGGAVVGLLCAILVVMFIVYRMRKKDEGSYALDEPKRSPANNSYAKNANNREFYA